MITVIDALMGEGKTQYVFRMMRDNPERRYIYIGLFNAETARCSTECPELDFHVPEKVGKSWTKTPDFIEKASEGRNIAATHQLFKYMTDELKQVLDGQGYTLVIDEALDVVSQYKFKSKADYDMLVKHGWLTIDGKGYLNWTGPDDNYHGEFRDLRKLCDERKLVQTKSGFILWRFPAHFLDVFEEVFICTYMFEGQTMAGYFQSEDVSYTIKTLSDGQLVPYDAVDNTDLKQGLARLISLETDTYRNAIGVKTGRGLPLTKTWYQKRTGAGWKKDKDISRLKNNLAAFFKEYGSAAINMVTCHDGYWNKLKGPRYGNKTRNYVPMNTKAVDEWKHKRVLAYPLDRHFWEPVRAYFQEREIAIRDDLFALTELVQWMWRSSIRDTPPKPIVLYLPSERMRAIFLQWTMHSDAEIIAGYRLDQEDDIAALREEDLTREAQRLRRQPKVAPVSRSRVLEPKSRFRAGGLS